MMPPRFEIISDAGGCWVQDSYGKHIRLPTSFGFGRVVRLPFSRKYESRNDAQLVVDWMNDREQGYPTADASESVNLAWDRAKGWAWSDAE